MAFESTIRELERKRANIDRAIEALRKIDEGDGVDDCQQARISVFARSETPGKVDHRRTVAPDVMEKRRKAMRDAWERRRVREAKDLSGNPARFQLNERVGDHTNPVQEGGIFSQEVQTEPLANAGSNEIDEVSNRSQRRAFRVTTD